VSTIADSGVNSALGAGSTIFLGQNSAGANGIGTLQFTGAAGGSSNRPINISNGATGGAGVIENTVAGQTLALSGALTTSTPASASGLTLAGAGDGLFTGGIADAPLLALGKTGTGSWTLSGITTYRGATNVTAGTLTFSAASVFDSATSVGTFTVNGLNAVANIAGTYNVGNGNGNAFFEIRGGGIVNFSGNSTLTCTTAGGGFRVGEAGIGTFNMSAGSLAYTSIAGSNFIMGRSAGGNGTVNLTGGTLTVAGPGGFIMANDAGTSAEVNISGTGTLVVNSAICRIGGNASATSAVINLNPGGTFALGASTTSTGGNRVLNMDGGTLRANGDITISNLTEANIKDGGVVIDSNGNTITINQALLDFAGATTATLNKSGAGTLRLSGANTYTGATSVTAGTLELAGGSQASPITVSGGASLGFVIGSPTISTSSFNLTAGTIKINGTPTLASYDLITSSAGITGTPVLDAPIAGYELKVVGNSLKLVGLGYASWAGVNGAGPNLNDDHDNDGVANGIEFFLGGPNGNTTGFTALPGVTNTAGTLSVTWVMGPGYAGVYGTDFTVATSDTLTGIWTPESSPGTVTISGSNVTYTFPAPLGTRKFARLEVTGP
jgi:autotransporter-associated beta strand protein